MLSLLLVSVMAAYFYQRGYFSDRVEYVEGAYWPDLQYGLDKVLVWHNGSVIYSDEYRYEVSPYANLGARDSLKRAHMRLAENANINFDRP